MLADLEKSSFSNIEQQSLEFVKYTLDPWVVHWEQSMCRALLMESEKPNVFIKFNVNGLLRRVLRSITSEMLKRKLRYKRGLVSFLSRMKYGMSTILIRKSMIEASR